MQGQHWAKPSQAAVLPGYPAPNTLAWLGLTTKGNLLVVQAVELGDDSLVEGGDGGKGASGEQLAA